MDNFNYTLAVVIVLLVVLIPASSASEGQSLMESSVSVKEVESSSLITGNPDESTYLVDGEHSFSLGFDADSEDSKVLSSSEGSRTSYMFFNNSSGDMTPVDRLYVNSDENDETERAYIVKVESSDLPEFNEFISFSGVKRTGSFSLKDMKGFSIIASEEEISELKESRDVTVYRDELVKINLDESVPQIGGDKLKNWGLNGSNIDVGVIDTGVDYSHPSLGGCSSTEFSNGNCQKVEGGYDFYDGDTDPMDENGHGTHVASTIAGSNDTYEGVAPGADIYGYRVLGPSGYGSSSDIIDAIERSVDPNGDGNTSDHLDIISLSLGGPGAANSAKAEAINSAVESGVLAVVAAGNSGSSYETVGSPGNAKGALSVGAVDNQDNIASFSSRGPVYYSNGSMAGIKPDLVAPGVDINAAWIDGGWRSIDGTSMATPHVSGGAALLMEDRNLTVTQTKSILKTTSNDLGKDVFTQGAGRINLTKAVNASVYFDSSSIFFGTVESNSFSKKFNVSPLPGEDSAKTWFEVSTPENLESSGECSPSFSFDKNGSEISSSTEVTMNVNNADSCSGILEGKITSTVESDGENMTHTLPYSFVKRDYLTVNVHDSSNSDTSAQLYVSNGSNGDTIETVDLTGGSTQIAIPQDNYVVTALKLDSDEKFILQKQVDTSTKNSVTLDASSATSVNYPGAFNGNNLWHRAMSIGFYSDSSYNTGEVSRTEMEVTGDQTIYVSKTPDSEIDWNISISGIAIKENGECQNGCGQEADALKELTGDIYLTAADFDTTSDVGDVSFTETKTTRADISYPGNLSSKTEYERTISWTETGSYVGAYLDTDTAVPAQQTLHQLEDNAQYKVRMSLGNLQWDQTLDRLTSANQASFGELPLLPGKAERGYNDLEIDNLLRGPNGNTNFRGSNDPRLRVYENGSKTLDQRDVFYWYGISRDLKKDTEYRIEVDSSMMDNMPAWKEIKTRWDISTGSDRIPPHFTKIDLPVKFTGSSASFDVEASDDSAVTKTEVYYRYRSSGNYSSWRTAGESTSKQVTGSIPRNSFNSVDLKIVARDDSGNNHTLIVQDGIVKPQNIDFELKGPSEAAAGSDAFYQGACKTDSGNCQGLRVFLQGDSSRPERVLSETDANEGYGIAGTFEEKINLPNSGSSYSFTFSFPGMNAYESIPAGDTSKKTKLVTVNPDSVVIEGTSKSYSSIQKAVNNAKSGAEIVVKEKYTGIKDSLPIKIDKPVTLRGQGEATLSGRARHLVLYVNAEPVTIRDLDIVGAAGGILYSEDSTEDTPMTVDNVTFSNLGSSQYGGAIMAEPGVEVDVKNSRFYNNSFGIYSTPEVSSFQDFTQESAEDARETVNSVKQLEKTIEMIRAESKDYSSAEDLREEIGSSDIETGSSSSYPVKVKNSEFTDNYIGVAAKKSAIRISGIEASENNIGVSVRDSSLLKATDSSLSSNRGGLISQSSRIDVSMTDIERNSEYGAGLVDSEGSLEDNWWGSGAGPTPFIEDLYSGQVSEYDRGDILISTSQMGALPMARPWLLGDRDNAEKLDQTIALKPGWNLISTPLRLYESEWSTIKQYGNGLSSSLAYRYNSDSENWEQLEGSEDIKPLEAYYVKTSKTDGIGFKWQSERGNTVARPSIRELDQGWNLVGVAINPGVDRPKRSHIAAEYFLNSVRGVTEQDTGYSTVISPSINKADWSVFTSNLDNSQTYGMYPYEGYWVFMENNDTLAGMNTEEELG